MRWKFDIGSRATLNYCDEMKKIENNLYRGFKKWELKFWKHPGVYTEYDLNTLPREVTLTTLVDWDILADETHGTGIGTRHNAEDEHGNLIPGNYIEEIFNEKISDNQLDKSPITFEDLSLIKESFQKSLEGLYHQRVMYPDISEDVRELEEE